MEFLARGQPVDNPRSRKMTLQVDLGSSVDQGMFSLPLVDVNTASSARVRDTTQRRLHSVQGRVTGPIQPLWGCLIRLQAVERHKSGDTDITGRTIPHHSTGRQGPSSLAFLMLNLNYVGTPQVGTLKPCNDCHVPGNSRRKESVLIYIQ